VVKFHVHYRLTHPSYLPAIARTIVRAQTHQELEAALAKVRMKWEARGYRVHILRVVSRKDA
jgi:hypothetical protein